MMQWRKLLIFRTVNGKSIIGFIVAIAVDKHHITIFRTICVCIGIIAGNDNIIQGCMKQIIQCATADLAFGTDGNDIIAVGKFRRKPNADHIGILDKRIGGKIR